MKKLITIAAAVALLASERSAQADVIIPPTTEIYNPVSAAPLAITYGVTESGGLYTYTYALTSFLPVAYLTSFVIGGFGTPIFTPTLTITESSGGVGTVNADSVQWSWAAAQLILNPVLSYTSDFGPVLSPFSVLDDGASWSSPPNIPAPAGVPEASTVLAGALMILPLGVGALRTLRKERLV